MRIVGLMLAGIVLWGCGTLTGPAGDGIVKVLPHYLDEEGQHTDGPTLLHRDVYQRELRSNPGLVHGVRYDVNWHGNQDVVLRLELRSSKPGSNPMTLEQTAAVGSARTHWTSIIVDPDSYHQFGQPEAWKVSIWRDEKLLDQKVSFLW